MHYIVWLPLREETFTIASIENIRINYTQIILEPGKR